MNLTTLLFLLSISGCIVAETRDSSRKPENVEKKPTKVISLAESINRSQKSLKDPERARASREQWESALKEIREIALDIPVTARILPKENSTKIPFTEWKKLLDQPSKVELNADTAEVIDEQDRPEIEPKPQTSRFEGFASWERMLQDWADDVQEYLDKVEAESANAAYPMATYTQPMQKREVVNVAPKIAINSDDEPQKINVTNTDSSIRSEENPMKSQKQKKKSKISLPVPAPAKDGEDVLPHTDISDKSKRIWIVTTAALPWMTGTAVNPLLRAAYMTEGRAEAGGCVTLMLPWLEREQDRDTVYGTKRDFDSPQEQESYIRNWLVEKAKYPEASEKLRIEWYEAWQSKAENSIYSMGDITAKIPAEDVDIMILEEPEHLNWYVFVGGCLSPLSFLIYLLTLFAFFRYRAPGEHWTDKFKHVVGIVHTNYFVYASDQPAAFIRVSLYLTISDTV